MASLESLGDKNIFSCDDFVLYRSEKKDAEVSIVQYFGRKFETASSINKLQSIKHPSILSLLSVNDETGKVYYEYFEGKPLFEVYKNECIGVEEFVAIAVQIVEALHFFHMRNIVLNNINSDNILYNKASKSVKIYNYLAEFMDKGSVQAFKNKLSFIAPEQTKRGYNENDQRIDLYSVGVLFYQLLTGKPPFVADSDLELIYAHTTQQPVAPNQINKKLPKIISDIVLHLLEKNANERYHSSSSLLADLNKCKDNIRQIASLDFQLDKMLIQKDFSIPNTLYGRNDCFEKLRDVFELCKKGDKQIVFINGKPGAGKSEMVFHYFTKLQKGNFFFVEGKFEQFQDKIPYYAFRKAIGRFCSILLSEDDETLSNWKARIISAVGIYGQLIIDIVPELETIIGKQPSLPETNAYEAQKRFLAVFGKFMQTVCTKEFPFVLFLDDWQWADDLSVDLFLSIFHNNDIEYLQIVVAYRSNEVYDGHVFNDRVLMSEELMNDTVEIKANNLTDKQIANLLADTLEQPVKKVMPLAKTVRKKTLGNPFYTRTFIQSLYFETLLKYDSEKSEWQWDDVEVESKEITGNLVDLISLRVKFLNKQVKDLLEIASCIGNRFSYSSIKIISGLNDDELLTVIKQSRADQFITCQSIEYGKSKCVNNSFCAEYKFTHDTVQQAFYNSIDAKRKEELHHKIGWTLYEKLTKAELNERMFEVVNHIIAGKHIPKKENRLIELIQMNMQCCQKAKSELAYSHALRYINTISDYITNYRDEDKLWLDYYDVILDYYKQKSQIEYLNALYPESESTIYRGIKYAKTKIDKAELYYVLIVQYTLRAKYKEAISVASMALRLFGIKLPVSDYEIASKNELEKIYKYFDQYGVESLQQLPVMKSAENKTIVKLLITMGPPCYRSHQQLWSVLVPMAVNICIQHGNVPQIGYSYTALGGLLGWMNNDYEKTEALGRVATSVMNSKFNIPSEMSVFYLMIGSSVRHWGQHLKFATADYEAAHRIGINSGNMQYTAYAYGHNMYCLFFQGMPLKELKENINRYLAFSHERQNKWAIELLKGGRFMIDSLKGEPIDKKTIKQFLIDCNEHKNIQVICIFNVLKCFVDIINGNFQEAEKANREAEARIFSVGIQGLLPWPENVYNTCLLAIYKIEHTANPAIKLKMQDELKSKHKQFEIWAKHSPDNYMHKLKLIEAEIARFCNELTKAWDCYEESIEAAKQHGFNQHVALANERCAGLWFKMKRDKVAVPYLMEAVDYYKRWGASFKVRQLELEYYDIAPQVFAGDKEKPAKSLTDIDLQTVYEFTHSIAKQVNIKKLSQELSRKAMISVSADRAVVLFNTKGKLTVESESTVHVNENKLYDSLYYKECREIPHQLIHYVIHTREIIYITDKNIQPQFLNDEYLNKTNLKSAICMPLIHADKLQGLLYLENKSYSSNFSGEKVKLLELLSTHMAISIENAMIYNNLEAIVSNRTEELENSQTELRLSNATKDKFLSIISHDLRSPFNSMLGFSKMLYNNYNKLDDERRLLFISNIDKALKNTFQLLEDILTWSRSQSGKIQIRPLKISVKTFFDEVISLMQSAAIKKRISFENRADEGLYIIADKNSINTVMRNLISNAIKFSHSDSIITLSADEISSDGENKVKISVTDSGVGIPKDRINDLFNIDTNISTRGTDDEKGTGLGLILCKEFIEKNSGQVGVESEENKGSCFYFILPGGFEKLEMRKSAKTVIIADDMNLNYLYLKELISTKYPQTVIKKAATGIQAVALCKEFEVDCVLMDLNMPEMDGIEATRKIKGYQPNIPIIIQTANSKKSVKEEALAAGSDFFVTKPISEDILLPMLHEYLG